MSQKKLSELEATAICGNDISSSCLYVSALSIAYAGAYAWIALLMVAGVLFLFRKVYGEVVGALPLNGGAYNVLLNTTSKSNAAIAAALTILSYMATAVISAVEAMHYLHHILPHFNIILATGGLLLLFLMLTILGISESAKVAVGIFLIHLVSLTTLVIFTGVFLYHNGTDVLKLNFSLPAKGGIGTALFFGFSAAMLGISGFESSANFVEEQKNGVFPKTLRNMWIVVSIFNPLIAFVAIAAMPIHEINDNANALLSHLGDRTFGPGLSMLISIDAVLVLSGAVLTSFVGVSGLMKRMTLDRIWPQFFLKENKRKSNYRILITFFILCISILLITSGDLNTLAGVYTISFLSVMVFFGLGNLLFKAKRSKMPRPEYATVFSVFVALLGVTIALFGNIKMHPDYLVVFLQYFLPSLLIIYAMLNRLYILNLFLSIVKTLTDNVRKYTSLTYLQIQSKIKEINNQEFVFFTKGDDISVLNKVMIYVQQNELTNKLKIVTVLAKDQSIADDFLRDLEVLDRAYPNIKIEFVSIEGTFGPTFIQHISSEWKIPVNFMFIGSPSNKFPYRISELGGVRLII